MGRELSSIQKRSRDRDSIYIYLCIYVYIYIYISIKAARKQPTCNPWRTHSSHRLQKYRPRPTYEVKDAKILLVATEQLKYRSLVMTCTYKRRPW